MKLRHFCALLLVSLLVGGCQKAAEISQDKVQIGSAFAPRELGATADKQDKVENSEVEKQENTEAAEPKNGNINTNQAVNANQAKPAPVEPAAPKVLNYPVAFATQAPFANWDQLHEEACEEAAMIMAVKYFKKETLSAHIMEQGILNLVKWEEENGYQVDLTAAEAVKVLADYFNQKSELTNDVSVEKIKQELIKGNLIVVPAAGRQLGNPNFKGEGPIYHMLVVRGYDDNLGEFITNDPGTRKGEGYRYKYKTLIAAVHDWDHQLGEGGMTNEEMEQGKKVLIIIEKQ